MRQWIRSIVTGWCLLGAFGAHAAEARAPMVDIAYEEFTLGNGLRVIVHTDRKAPLIAVNLWYHVGSKDEPAGRSGFAHLFEHLMFQSSEHHAGEYFVAMEKVGAIYLNGTTNRDRTNYYQTVPTTALALALFMESDRMGHLLGAIDQAGLDAQRGVVQNEKRQKENQPYGQRWEVQARASFPPGHPYHHTTIGSINDINAASLADVKSWFRSWYGPNNAVLVLAGDIDLATAKREVPRYFGHIPASATVPRQAPAIAARRQSTRQVIRDRVAQTRIYKAWNAASYDSADIETLQLLAHVLGGGEASRLSRRLRVDQPLVDKVSASISVGELAATFTISADVRSGVDPARVEQAITDELATLLADGPDPTELAQARGVFRGQFIRGLERVSDKAEILNECATFTGDPGCFRRQFARLDSTSADDIRAAGRRWLQQGDDTLLIVPGERVALVEDPAVTAAPLMPPAPDPKFTTLAAAIDRSQGPPDISQFPSLLFPAVERGRLANGLQILVATRPGLPLVQMRMDFPGGTSSDAGGRLGTAKFAMGLLDEGAGARDAVAFNQRAETLGAEINTDNAVTHFDASLDLSSVSLSALTGALDESLALYADVIRRPQFDAAASERERVKLLAALKQGKTRPDSIASRLLVPALYPAGHAYALPFNGMGDEASVSGLTRADALQWHRRHVRPDTASLLIVGDTSLARILPLLERHFGDWRAPDLAPPRIGIGQVPLPPAPRVLLVDVPDTVQTTIAVGQRIQASTDPLAPAFDVANRVLGGAMDEGPVVMFGTRLNLNLREDKQWTYVAYTYVVGVNGPRPWVATSPVQTDKTAESIIEMRREIVDLASGRRPVTAEELANVQAFEVRILPGAFEVSSAVLGAMGDNLRLGRPDDDVSRRPARLQRMTTEQVSAAAAVIKPEALTWVIIGDLARIEAGVRALNLGEVSVVDADGKPVAPK